MELTQLAAGLGIDLVAIALLAYGVYFPRHGKADLALAFVALNVGVFAAVALLASAEVGMGIAFGLFGILSIIRLRSSEISQREVAYYFSSLAIGLIAGVPHTDVLVPLALIALILAVMFVADHPMLLPDGGTASVRLDRAVADETELRSLLERRLGLDVASFSVQQVDFVNDTTLVEARLARPARTRSTIAERA